MSDLDLAWVRAQFPGLSDTWALLDNAGGSVPTRAVIDRVTDYLTHDAVQLGATYPRSQAAMEKVRAGEAAMARLLGCDPDEIVVGPSTTMNAMILARALGAHMKPGDEVVVTDADHEANVHPWVDLRERGVEVRTWKLKPETGRLHLEDLEPLLSERTRLVAFTHCSNVVGHLQDVAAITSAVHDAGAMVCVDGVAYAPHRRADVRALDVDFYLFSPYKVYGPHVGVLYGKTGASPRREGAAPLLHRRGPDPVQAAAGQSQPRTHRLARRASSTTSRRSTTTTAGAPPATRSTAPSSASPITKPPSLRGCSRTSNSRSDIQIVGDLCSPTGRSGCRRSRSRSRASHRARSPRASRPIRIAVRHGHFYAYRAVEALGLLDAGGVVRVSMVHYDTLEEVDRLVAGTGGHPGLVNGRWPARIRGDERCCAEPRP